jgi:hypothetical protein
VLRLAMAVSGVRDAVLRECRDKQTGISGWLRGKLGFSCDELKPNSEALLDYVQNGYAVGAAGRSRVINISYQSPRPEIAQMMANALTNAFLEDQRSNLSSGRHVAADWLWQELRQLDREIRDEDAKIEAFRGAKGLTRGTYAQITSERLTAISQQLSAAQAARDNAAARLQEIRADQAAKTSTAPAVLASRAVADLKQQITTATAELGNASATLGPNHPSLRCGCCHRLRPSWLEAGADRPQAQETDGQRLAEAAVRAGGIQRRRPERRDPARRRQQWPRRRRPRLHGRDRIRHRVPTRYRRDLRPPLEAM